jgi:hypothetical protein
MDAHDADKRHSFVGLAPDDAPGRLNLFWAGAAAMMVEPQPKAHRPKRKQPPSDDGGCSKPRI